MPLSDITDLLAEHGYIEVETPNNGWIAACECDDWLSDFPGPDIDGDAAYRNHLAEVIEAHYAARLEEHHCQNCGCTYASE